MDAVVLPILMPMWVAMERQLVRLPTKPRKLVQFEGLNGWWRQLLIVGNTAAFIWSSPTMMSTLDFVATKKTVEIQHMVYWDSLQKHHLDPHAPYYVYWTRRAARFPVRPVSDRGAGGNSGKEATEGSKSLIAFYDLEPPCIALSTKRDWYISRSVCLGIFPCNHSTLCIDAWSMDVIPWPTKYVFGACCPKVLLYSVHTQFSSFSLHCLPMMSCLWWSLW